MKAVIVLALFAIFTIVAALPAPDPVAAEESSFNNANANNAAVAAPAAAAPAASAPAGPVKGDLDPAEFFYYGGLYGSYGGLYGGYPSYYGGYRYPYYGSYYYLG